jgi:hypothetical protein
MVRVGLGVRKIRLEINMNGAEAILDDNDWAFHAGGRFTMMIQLNDVFNQVEGNRITFRRKSMVHGLNSVRPISARMD